MGDTLISGHTRLFALLGSPVTHSLSPRIHNASFAHLGVDARYVVFDVTPDRLDAAVSGIRALGIAGFNLTMPHKRAVIEYLDTLSPAAELIGAVNTVECRDGKLIGHNTDGAGMMRALREAGAQIEGARIVILGAGGAALAMCAQAGLDKAGCVDVAKRANATFGETREAVAALSAATATDMSVIDFADENALREACSGADIIINATPIGMGDTANASPIASEVLHKGQFVADAVYHPRMTRLLNDAHERGAIPVEGVGMLLWQGLIAEEIWLADELARTHATPSPTPILPLLELE